MRALFKIVSDAEYVITVNIIFKHFQNNIVYSISVYRHLSSIVLLILCISYNRSSQK